MNDIATSPSLNLAVEGRNLDFYNPEMIGIVNITPDSFYDGGRYAVINSALQQLEQMVEAGADIIDIGGESTRPGSEAISDQEEIDRVMPVLEKAMDQYPEMLFSVDTKKYNVAKAALESGTHLINDISGLQNEPRLAGLCAEYDAGFILMHSQGDPKVMQDNPVYDDVVNDLYLFFREKINFANQEGLQNIIIDPGFCFGTTLQHNLRLLRNLDAYIDLGCPIMAAASRKSMIGQLLGDRPTDERLYGTLAVHYHALTKGANILRVHDVQETKDCVRIFEAVED